MGAVLNLNNNTFEIYGSKQIVYVLLQNNIAYLCFALDTITTGLEKSCTTTKIGNSFIYIAWNFP